MAKAFGGETAESYYDEGLTASMRGELALAASHFEKAIHLDRGMGPAYQQLGKCYARMGKGEAAVKLLREVVSKRPAQTAARIDLGYAYIGLGDLDRAKQAFQEVLVADSDNIKAQLGLAQADFDEGNWDAAMRRAQDVLASGGSNFSVLYLLGRAARLAGDIELSKRTLEKADALIEKILEVNADKPEGHFLRGEIAFFQERFAAALDHYRAAVEQADKEKGYTAYGINIGYVDILAKQGLCLQRLDRSDRARDVGDRIGEIDPEHPLGKSLREAK